MHEFLVSTAAFVVLVGVMVSSTSLDICRRQALRVRVEAFSFGFGPRLFGIKYGETDYKVCLLPLGGYVKMTGETPDQVSGVPTAETDQTSKDSAADPGSFTSHPRWQRILIGSPGR